MTPRERDTLETILRNVATFNGWDGKVSAKPTLHCLAMIYRCQSSPNGIMTHAGDIVIDDVTFRPTGAQCA